MRPALPNTRYERKFILAGVSASEAVGMIRRHPALFREPYPERAVNNIYFDTPDLHHYHDHLSGSSERMKVRIRWYGAFAGQIVRPALEFKSRHGTVSGKESYPFPAFTLNGSFPCSVVEEAHRDQALPKRAKLHLGGLRPVLGNRYRRRYFCSASRALRLTVDWALEFSAIANGAHGLVHSLPGATGFVIIELKYGPPAADEAAFVISQLPVRLTRCSKYILGVQRIPGAAR